MEKKFYKYALYAVLGSACLSVIGSVILLIVDQNVGQDTTFANFIYYMKIAFDMLALFVGLGTIIFGFSEFGIKGGLMSMLIYSGSFAISVIWFVIGFIIEGSDRTIETIIVTLYYAIGVNFITQIIAAIIVGLISYHLTKKSSADSGKFFDFKTPVGKATIFSTLAVFGLNFLSLYGLSVFPFLISEDFYIYFSDFLDIIVWPTLETVIEYLVVQYIVYMLVRRAYKSLLKNKKK